jgi:hypothetical protein
MDKPLHSEPTASEARKILENTMGDPFVEDGVPRAIEQLVHAVIREQTGPIVRQIVREMLGKQNAPYGTGVSNSEIPSRVSIPRLGILEEDDSIKERLQFACMQEGLVAVEKSYLDDLELVARDTAKDIEPEQKTFRAACRLMQIWEMPG